MRAIVLCCALFACATVDTRPPPERLAGCWINRDAGPTTMRWLPSGDQSGALEGARLVYGGAGVRSRTRYTLQSSEVGWSLCELDGSGAATRCWQVAMGEGGSLQGGRAFIDASGDRLHISVLGDGPEFLIFHGRRDGCD